MFQLKVLHKEAIPAAIEKAERYRFLQDSSAAESICRDILQVDAANQQVLVMLILTLTDQFGAVGSVHPNQVRDFLPRLTSEYQRTYYAGIICERWAKAQLNRAAMGASALAYEWLMEAMDWYDQAEKLRTDKNDEALLRWNSCARVIAKHRLEARDEPFQE